MAGETVLIVENDDLNMKLFDDLLRLRGYRTLQCKDRGEALTLTRAHRPDLVLLDIRLPEPSGFELTRLIKGDPELGSIPVVAVTAYALKGDEERIRAGGCDGYLAKPISATDFLATVAGFLNKD